ncbi:hypothetical protein BDP27DRAFT_1428153 [Rhodocollybia butyracea]|uniref:Uncharacterized protein n=1 Tax=Rhodocollybia butyracea TaxID=206335 RepID=A0A9P5PB05_9AGAR|nr:hypothetical protein BDP27DRAFT_1428153 [Rhodocollybia butyracea]
MVNAPSEIQMGFSPHTPKKTSGGFEKVLSNETFCVQVNGDINREFYLSSISMYCKSSDPKKTPHVKVTDVISYIMNQDSPMKGGRISRPGMTSGSLIPLGRVDKIAESSMVKVDQVNFIPLKRVDADSLLTCSLHWEGLIASTPSEPMGPEPITVPVTFKQVMSSSDDWKVDPALLSQDQALATKPDPATNCTGTRAIPVPSTSTAAIPFPSTDSTATTAVKLTDNFIPVLRTAIFKLVGGPRESIGWTAAKTASDSLESFLELGELFFKLSEWKVSNGELTSDLDANCIIGGWKFTKDQAIKAFGLKPTTVNEETKLWSKTVSHIAAIRNWMSDPSGTDGDPFRNLTIASFKKQIEVLLKKQRSDARKEEKRKEEKRLKRRLARHKRNGSRLVHHPHPRLPMAELTVPHPLAKDRNMNKASKKNRDKGKSKAEKHSDIDSDTLDH